ncbi:MAG: DUF3168 domain-containing protein [Pseudomonadales bacterium]|nr:DUF3168 domain-containing protein [Pseudomonadales bacterium]
MPVEQEIYTRLSAYTDLTDLVNTRIYPSQLPQNTTLPAITYRRVSSSRFSAMGADSGVVKGRFQFDIWGNGVASYKSCVDIRTELQAALQRWSTSGGSTDVFDIFLLNEIDLYETVTETTHLVIDYEINYKES